MGGGGLLAGVLAYVKQVRPDVLCYGVEARDAAAMTASCFEGEIVGAQCHGSQCGASLNF